MARVKICGLTNQKDALSAAELGAWALGFIFYKKSPRYVEPKTVKKIISILPKNLLTIGVFVNEPLENIKHIAQDCGLKALQFHGQETPFFCAQFKQYKTIKAFRIKDRIESAEILKYKTDYYLFDTFKEGAQGGTGEVFNWQVLKGQKIPGCKIIVSGGLNPDNIQGALSTLPAYAYDVSSGVERRPGKKCTKLLRKFFEQVKGG